MKIYFIGSRTSYMAKPMSMGQECHTVVRGSVILCVCHREAQGMLHQEYKLSLVTRSKGLREDKVQELKVKINSSQLVPF
jgi:hypothetical protein